ncbi:MAG: dihydropteroate synthase [Sedimentisphaerales bacterium]|nr:dihydropteroate synthase [Sedimentisphaerales bacterium]
MADKYLIQIGESVHASIPKSGAAMKDLVAKGEGAYTEKSEPLDYLVSLIVDQVANGADFIAINVDAFGETDPQLAVDLMKEYVKLVRQHGSGVPACIDSSDVNVLKAGLEQWYQDAPSDIAMPLVNSVKTTTMSTLLPWRAKHAFKVVGMLVDEEGKADEASADTLYGLAKRIFRGAMEHGFAAEDIFFDTTTYPLAIDMPLTPGTPSFTYRAFEAIKKIKSDPEMKDCHCSLGVSNSVRDLPARKIGVCRAYVAKAKEYGLDAGIVNVMHHYGETDADAELMELVEAFALQDGSADASMKAMMVMGEFCSNSRK